MKDLISDIEKYLTYYRTLYGNKVFLSQPLTQFEPEAEQHEPIKKVDQRESPAFNSPQLTGKLAEFFTEIKDCQKCQLGALRTHFVFGTGDSQADIMFVGEAPGQEEDIKGEPFVGKAGQLLDMMLRAIGLSRQQVFIANVLKCRPPNNRDPLPDEIEKCEPYLLEQVKLIQPRLLVALGRFAASSLLKSTVSLAELRNAVHTYCEIPLIVTYHPAALLRNSQWKKFAWDDLKKIKKTVVKS